jgi:mannan endo-1,4-beta-mannosidase
MKKLILTLFVGLSFLSFLLSCSKTDKDGRFVYVKEGHFIKNGEPYYFTGTNLWYGAILASEGTGGDTLRLFKELDKLKEMGIENLRVLVGSDGLWGATSKVEPTLQTAPGVYNDTILRGLDRFMVELSKREMSAVLYLNNSWEWSGGYSQYLMWAGYGKAPLPGIDGWDPFVDYVKQFVNCDSCKSMFDSYVKFIVSRTNSITGIKYKDDPTIFSWQIGNEPRAFAKENKEVFEEWMGHVAKLIKSIDSNHMVSSGSEGKVGCEMDIELYERIHSVPEIDYLNIHIWPLNWSWVSKERLAEGIPAACDSTSAYIEEHLGVAKRLNKPIVIEEFGYPRDNYLFTPGSPVVSRDMYYKFILDYVAQSAKSGGLLGGCNFWAWSGYAVPDSINPNWKKGDDYCGDPAQEPQGLYSVFLADTSTVKLIINQKSKLVK